MDPKLTKNISIGLPPQIKSARNFLIELVLLVVVCVLLGWFVVMPKNAELSLKQDQLAQVQSEQAKTADKLKQLKNIVQTIQANPQQINYLDQALPLDGKIVRFKIFMDALANSAGVVVGDVSVSSGKADETVAGDKTLLANPYGVSRSLQKLSGSVYVIGSFPQLKAFLQKLETSARILDVTDLSLDGAPDGSLNMKLSINAYYLAP